MALLVIGTANRKKGEELAGLLAPLGDCPNFRGHHPGTVAQRWSAMVDENGTVPFDVPLGLSLQTLADFPTAISVDENGVTFAENARLKAAGQARHLGHWVLADDSGLAVDALGGAPGVFSARYAGPEADDQANNQRLLDELRDVPDDRRTAAFVCHVSLSDPTGAILAESEAACRGRILHAPRGSAGFGYDPLFEIVEYHRSFAELGTVAKACLSHRARAMRQIMPALRTLMATGGLSQFSS